MTVRHKKKIGSRRGFRTCGTGNTKNIRGKGSHMGNPHLKSKGGGARNFMHIVRYTPGRLVRKGFYNATGKEQPGINVCDLEKIAENGSVDAAKKGYRKILGKGEIGSPLTVTAEMFTPSAEKKITAAGGKVIKTAAVNDAKVGNKG